MQNKDEKNTFKKSYESDGIMGKNKKKQLNKKDSKKEEKAMFFNTTESSE